MAKQVSITIDFVVDDGEAACFLGNTEDDILGQTDTMKDWLRDAFYDYCVNYKIKEFAGKEIVAGQFNL